MIFKENNMKVETTPNGVCAADRTLRFWRLIEARPQENYDDCFWVEGNYWTMVCP